jgi:hypothetical protein
MKRSLGFALVLAFMLSGIATVFAYEEIGPEEAYNMVEAIENAYIYLEPNKFFDEEVVRQFDPDVDILILICRSGKRGGKACVEIGTE